MRTALLAAALSLCAGCVRFSFPHPLYDYPVECAAKPSVEGIDPAQGLRAALKQWALEPAVCLECDY